MTVVQASTRAQIAPLPANLRVDWDEVRTTLLRQGEPARVPFMEIALGPTHKRRIIGRPVRTLADDLEVSRRLGQPFVVISIGLHDSQTVLDAMATAAPDGAAAPTDEAGWAHGKERRWAHGTESVIRCEADFEAFPWPDPDDFDYTILAEADRLLPANYRVILTVGKIFNLGWWLMGFDTFAYALADNPGLIERLYQRIAAIQAGVVERAIEHRSVGMVWHADDMAYGSGPMVSPRFLRRAILPTYKRLNRMCKQKGLLTGFHSDGNADALIDDIIDAGFDSFNPVEPLAMDIRALKKRVAGRLALTGNVDLSYTLTRGTPAEVDAEVRELIRDLGPGGGYGLASANSVPEYVPWENFVAMHSAWLAYSRYPIDL